MIQILFKNAAKCNRSRRARELIICYSCPEMP